MDRGTETARRTPPLVVVMGVSGCGKTTAGARLAERLGVAYGEADDFHPQRNIDKMSSGQPLDDADRAPWLAAIGAWLHQQGDRGAVATCSALKRAYRDVLRTAAPATVFLHLAGSRAVIEARMQGRSDHFMPTSLLDSQFATLEPLEPDEPGLTVDATLPTDNVIAEFLTWWWTRTGEADLLR